MRHREPPEDRHYGRNPFFERSARCQGLVQSLLHDPTGRGLPNDLADHERVIVEAEFAFKRWGGRITRRGYRDAIEWAMNETKPRVVAPRSDRPTQDFVCA